MNYIISLIIGYLIGSIPFSYIIVKVFKGLDLTTIGSKNCGATNVYRAAGFGYAFLTAVFDASKGGIAYYTAWYFFDQRCALIAGFLAVVGHCFSVWLKFKGGKGSATGFGLVFFVAWQAGVTALVLFILIIAITRYVSLASIIVAMNLSPSMWLFTHDPDKTILAAIVGLFVIVMHRSNIKRLLGKNEKKII